MALAEVVLHVSLLELGWYTDTYINTDQCVKQLFMRNDLKNVQSHNHF